MFEVDLSIKELSSLNDSVLRFIWNSEFVALEDADKRSGSSDIIEITNSNRIKCHLDFITVPFNDQIKVKQLESK